MRFLKQSTSVDLPIGPFVDSVDGVTAEAALVITQPDIRLKKNGAAWAQKNAVQTLTHEENGNYEVTLDATDTNTLGLLRLHVAEAGALPVWEDFMVVPANVWDSLFGADLLQVDTRELTGTAQTARDLGAQMDVVVSTRASQASVDDVPTNAELTAALAAADDAVLAAIAALNNLSAAQVAAELATYDGPTNAEMVARTLPTASYATAVNLATVAGFLDTEVQAILDIVGSGTFGNAALKTLIDALTTAVAALPTATTNRDALLAAIIEGTVTLKQSLQLSNAAAAGKLSGAATNAIALRNLADTIDRIAATVDADGNRTAVVRTFE